MLFAQKRFPNIVRSDPEGGGGAKQWNDPTNASSINNSFAYYIYESGEALTRTPDYLTAIDFNFALPSSAYIRGIRVDILCYREPNQLIKDELVYLYDEATSQYGDNKGRLEPLPSSLSYLTYGHSNDMWSWPETWSLDYIRGYHVNSANFGIRFKLGSSGPDVDLHSSGYVDAISATVYYWAGDVSGDNQDVFPLYIKGVSGYDNTIPLYVAGGTLSTGDIPLYTYGVEVNSGIIPLYTYGYDSISGNIPLYITGNITEYSGIPLCIFGLDYSSGNIPLYTVGSLSDSGNITFFIDGLGFDSGIIPLFVTGGGDGSSFSGIPMFISGDPSNNISLYTYGHESMSGNIPFFINGLDSITSNIPLHISGVFYMTANMPLFINAGTLTNSGTNIPLYLQGNPYSASTDYLTQSIPLYINSDNFWAEMPLFLQGADSAIISGAMYLHISGAAPTYSNTIPLYIASSGSTQVIPLYIFGQHPGISFDPDIEGYYPFEASLDLFLRINPSETIPLFICSNIEQSGMYLYTQGAFGQESGIPLYVYGAAQPNSNIPLHTFGF